LCGIVDSVSKRLVRRGVALVVEISAPVRERGQQADARLGPIVFKKIFTDLCDP
jgi:hypothetical protein